jgi:deferrochelatase/peroxidase EfeB
MTIDRRRFLLGTGLGAAAGAAAVLAGTGVADAAAIAAPVAGSDSDATLGPVSFEGEHQAGILTPAPPAAAFVTFDVLSPHRAGLAELFKVITSRARILTAGYVPPNLGVMSPPSDSGTLGSDVPPDALTVTLGVSSTLFDDRFGLASQRPIRLTPMQAFPNDGLDPDYLGGDMLLQLCAGSTDTVLHALRDIDRHTRGAMQMRWRMDGFLSPPRPDGVPRNHLGFMDGIANPDVSDPHIADQLLWVVPGHGEPDWAIGGSYHVIRLIRMFTEFWDRVSLNEQQTMIGRYRASGAPLGMTSYLDIPDYRSDPHGSVIPLTAHIRLANPRTTRTEPSRILRRGYNYDLGLDAEGNLNMGLVFNCFQQDLIRQFEATQTRLTDEPLANYVRPFGGGYFFALPGVRDARDWYGRRLLEGA